MGHVSRISSAAQIALTWKSTRLVTLRGIPPLLIPPRDSATSGDRRPHQRLANDHAIRARLLPRLQRKPVGLEQRPNFRDSEP